MTGVQTCALPICEGAEGEARSIPFLKRFVVFNAAQCDGLPERLTADPTPLPAREQHEDAETLIAATGADFRIGGARAFYDVGGDYVQVPPQPAFTHQIDFYRTALHELGHWTGSKARPKTNPKFVHESNTSLAHKHRWVGISCAPLACCVHKSTSA